jgi:putative ABC transport system permease protein
MWRTTLRGLLSHKLRMAMSALAIVLGVAFVAGTLIFTDTLSRTFGDLFTATSADVNVAPKAAFDGGVTGPGALAGSATIPQSAVDTIRTLPGVAAVSGVVQAQGVYVVGRDGKVLDTKQSPAIGIGWDIEPTLNPAGLTAGRGPARDGEIALDTATVDKTGYQIGDTVPVLTPGPRVEARLVGVFRFGSSGGLAGASLTAFDTATAQRLLGKPGGFSGVSIAAAEGVDDPELQQQVRQAIGDGFDVKTRQEQADSSAAALESSLSFFSTILLVFAGVALFVGSFLILNTFSMLVAQRSKELALLRALGASRSQVTRSVLAEALALGLVGSTVGLGAGLGIAAALRALFAKFGLTLDGGLVFSTRTVLWSYGVGVVVTVVAAYLPARRASRTPPVAAMRDEASQPERSLRRRTVAGAGLCVLGAGALVVSSTTDDGSSAAAWVGGGAVALVIGTIALSPGLAVPFLRTAGALLPAVWGRAGHLAQQNALRNPRRTAATASALMIGLTLVSAFSILGASTTASIDKLIGQGLRADFVVSTAVNQPFSPEVANRIKAVDGVGTVMQHRFGAVHVDGGNTFLTAVDPAALDQTVTLDYVAGSTAGLRGTGLLVDQPTAAAHGWSVGSTVQALLPNATQLNLVVGGIYRANQVIGTLVVPLDTYTTAGGAALDQFVYVDLAPGADPASVRSALDGVLAAYPVVTVKDQDQFRGELKSQVNQLLLLIDALLALSVLIAVLGIVNTLALAVIERTREIGLLRAVGMERSQLRRMVRLESVVISVYGASLGLVLGVVLGIALTGSLSGQGIEVLSVPVLRLAGFLAVSASIGVLAALWPARRAARLRILTAIAAA